MYSMKIISEKTVKKGKALLDSHNIGPLDSHHEEGIGCIETMVLYIIVSSLHRSGVLSVIEYVLMSTMWVTFPYLAIVNKEISGMQIMSAYSSLKIFSGHFRDISQRWASQRC